MPRAETSTATSTSSFRRPPAAINADPVWIDARFERAVDIVQSLPRSGPIQTNYDDKLLLYSVYKQATEGDIKTGRPNLLDVLGRAKWDAWNRRRGLKEDEAKRLYVEGLIKILRGFADRSQAVDLIRELEDFTVNVQASILSGSLPNTDSDSEATTSTAPPPRSSRHLQPPPPAPGGKGKKKRATGPPSSVGGGAPSLPGYGPPRTISDSPRALPAKSRRSRAAPVQESEESSETESEEETWQPPPPARVISPPPLGPYPPNTPLGIGRGPASPQQYGMAMMGAPTMHQSLPSLSAPAPINITSSLDRISTSLTALHERLNDLERIQRLVPPSSASSSFLGSMIKFLKLLFVRFVLQKRGIQSSGISGATQDIVESARRSAVDICLVVLVGWFVRGRIEARTRRVS